MPLIQTPQCNLIQGSEPVQLQYESSGYNIYGFVPDGKFLITYDSNSVQICDVYQQKLQCKIKTESLNKFKLNYEGKLLFVISENNKGIIYNIEKDKQIGFFQEHTNRVNQLALSTDNQILATCSDDSSIKLFDLDIFESEKILSSYSTLSLFSPIKKFRHTLMVFNCTKNWPFMLLSQYRTVKLKNPQFSQRLDGV